MRAVVERFPVVGRIEEAPAATAGKGWSKITVAIGALFLLGVVALLLLLR